MRSPFPSPLKIHLVPLWLGFFFLAGRAQELPPEVISYADLVLYNGKILTADADWRVAQAVAVRGGRFLAVGDNERILAMAGPATKRIDLQGRTVLPGFVCTDADNEFAGGNLYKDTLIRGELLGTQRELQSKEQVLARLGELVATVDAGEKVFVRLPETSAGIYLTRQELDLVAPRNPVALSIDSTNMVINSAMLALLTQRLPVEHPHILKDPETGEPNGRIYGFATGVVGWDLRPWPRIDERFLEEQRRLMADLNKKGITTVVGHIQGFSLAVLNLLWHRGEVTVRVRGSHDFLRQNPFAEAYLRRLGNLVDFGLGEDVVIVGAGLASADGNHDTGSALTVESKLSSGGYAFGPYGQNKWIGYGAHDRRWEDLSAEERRHTEWANILAAVKYGWNPTAIHNVGDKATQLWLEALQEALQQQDLALSTRFRPFGLDHNLFWREDQDELIKRLDVRRGLGKMFRDMPQAVEIYGDRLHDVQPVPALLERDLKIHIEGTDPLEDIQRYVTRRDRRGRIWGPDHAVDRKTALLMKTLWAARFIGEEHKLGSIQAGKLADLVVLGRDYLSVPESELAQIPVVMTVVGGKIVYESDSDD